jgi:hypothetical protein
LLRPVLFYSIVTRGGASVSVLVDIWLDVYICSVIDEPVIEILLQLAILTIWTRPLLPAARFLFLSVQVEPNLYWLA